MYLSPVYTAAPAVADERVGTVFAALDSLGIPYIRFEHDATATMEDCAAVGKALEGTICKNLFLCNRAATQFYLFLLGADKPFVTREISHALGVSRLSFGKDEPLFAMLHTHPGAVSPMGLIFPEAAPVRLLCDRSLTALPAIAFHPLTPAASLWMPADAFFHRFLPLTGHEVTFLDV